MTRWWLIIVLALIAATARADITTTGAGGKGNGGGAPVNCGTGVLDFSSGCAPMLGGI